MADLLWSENLKPVQCYNERHGIYTPHVVKMGWQGVLFITSCPECVAEIKEAAKKMQEEERSMYEGDVEDWDF